LPATEVTFIAFSKAVANLLRLFCALDGETNRELTVSKTTRYVSDIHAKAKKSASLFLVIGCLSQLHTNAIRCGFGARM